MAQTRHIPVMIGEVLDALSPKDGGVYVDATFGFGGYTTAILEKANCRVIGVDRDPEVVARANEIKSKYKNRFDFHLARFSNLLEVIQTPLDGIVFDIGVSSMQLDTPERGFSYAKEANLDMRMSQEGTSAYELVNNLPEEELAHILFEYADEKKSRQIAKKIVSFRQQKPIETTTELAQIVYHVIPKRAGTLDPATRTFQAIRIAVNDEFSELKSALEASKTLLKPEGRLVVVDFHSIEDRIVKTFLKENTTPKVHTSRYALKQLPFQHKAFSWASDIITPSKEEMLLNTRAHSAKLRYAIKTKESSND